MPTNTTNTTNTTPLSAMTGEEVASILVNLIRQNDGVLIQQKVTDGINQSAAGNDIAQGKAAIVASLQSVGITATTNDTLTVLAAKMLQAIAIINNATFTDGTTIPLTLGSIIFGLGKIKKIEDNDLVSVSGEMIGYLMSNLQYISLPKYKSGALINISNYRNTYNYHEIKCLNIPNYEGGLFGSVIVWNTGNNFIYCNSLRHVYGCSGMSYSHTYGTNQFPVIYDLKPYHEAGLITTTRNFKSWIPSTALSSASNSLCDHDEWDDTNEPSNFANNLQKFLWYFEYHFIPCFGTVTTSPVLSLYTTVYNAINSATSISDPTKTLKQLLTDKGWEVASVS